MKVGEAELAAMTSILSEHWRHSGPNVDHHIGDLAWGLHDRSTPTEVLFLEDEAYVFKNEDPYRLAARPGRESAYVDLIEAVGEDAAFWLSTRMQRKSRPLPLAGSSPKTTTFPTWSFPKDGASVTRRIPAN